MDRAKGGADLLIAGRLLPSRHTLTAWLELAFRVRLAGPKLTLHRIMPPETKPPARRLNLLIREPRLLPSVQAAFLRS